MLLVSYTASVAWHILRLKELMDRGPRSLRQAPDALKFKAVMAQPLLDNLGSSQL